MENATGRLIGEIAFYVAIAALLALFFVKKYKQVKNAEKEKKENQQ